jgi:hypothetical protein
MTDNGGKGDSHDQQSDARRIERADQQGTVLVLAESH